MLEEISAAVIFLVRLIERSENFSKEQLEDFKTCLSQLLAERFKNHWFPDQPCKGQGYRCIRVNEWNPRDATLERAATTCGFKYEDLKLPLELTIWVDPNEVCCRFGERQGSCCTLASFNDKENIAVVDKQAEKTGTIESKSQVTPLGTNNQYQGNMKKGGHSGGTHKQNKSGSRYNKNWGGHNGNIAFHHPLQSWYSLIPHNWMSPSPYLVRTPPGGKWGAHVPNHRNHWQGYNHHNHNHHKSTMKF